MLKQIFIPPDDFLKTHWALNIVYYFRLQQFALFAELQVLNLNKDPQHSAPEICLTANIKTILSFKNFSLSLSRRQNTTFHHSVL